MEKLETKDIAMDRGYFCNIHIIKIELEVFQRNVNAKCSHQKYDTRVEKAAPRIPIEGMGIRIRFINTFETAAMILIYVAGLVSLIRYIVFIKIWNIPAISPAKSDNRDDKPARNKIRSGKNRKQRF